MSSPGTLVNYESDTGSEERSVSHPKIKIQAKFRIARPPPKSQQRLRLTPKLLLQIQQLPPNRRPVPVLEIWQTPLCKSKLTRGFPQRPKLGTRDIYATVNEPYITSTSNGRTEGDSSNTETKEIDDKNAPNKDIVAAMCHSPNNDKKTSTLPSLSSIHFRHARCIWQVSAGTTGRKASTPCYRFIIKNEANTTGAEQSRMIMQWEKRAISASGDGNRASVAGPGNEHFVLLAIDCKERRKSRIATMNPDGLEITVRKSSILEHLRTCLALTEPVHAVDAGDSCGYEDLETWLYTHVLTLGVWVASQEGWLK